MKILARGLGRNRSVIEFTERNSLWCLTINVGIGAKKQNEELSKLYSKLLEEHHDWILDNWKSEEPTYYLRATD